MEVEQNKKLKIAFFIDSFFPMIDGVISVVDNYARRLAENNDVTVFTVGARDKTYVDNFPYKVVRCKRIKLKNFKLDYDMALPKLDSNFKKQIENGDFDIVHIHSPFAIGKMGVKYAKKHNIPAVATIHSQYKKDFMKETHSKIMTNLLVKKIMRVFNACDECWAVNENVAKIYFNEYGAKHLPKVRHNATDMQPLKDLSLVESLKQKYGITNEKVLLFVGRLTVIKNILFIVEALKKCKDMGLKFKMLFVGTGPDAELLQNKIDELNLHDEIVLVGKIVDRVQLSAYYNMADLFLFPSLYDCSSLVQIESASQKTPALFIENSATADGVEDNKNGYLSANSVEDYANKIVEIFKNEKQHKKVCENAFASLYVGWDTAVCEAYKEYLRMIDNCKK